MDIYERLKVDHEKQRALCDELLKTEGDSPERRTLWEEFRVELEAHALAEEQTFYAALIERPKGTEKARHSISEHHDAACLVKELEDADMASGGWLQKFKKLAHEVEHHLDEEEKETFPLARELIEDSEARKLAARFNERKPVETRKEQREG